MKVRTKALIENQFLNRRNKAGHEPITCQREEPGLLLEQLLSKVRCSECGVPRWLSIFGVWTPDAIFKHTLGGHEPPPSIIIEVGEYRNIFESLKETLGFNIDRIITEAERKSVRAWFEDIIGSYPDLLVKSDFMKRLLMKAYVLLGCMSGVGRLEICNLDPETHITYLCRHLYYEPLAIGDVQGFFEAFFGDSVAKGMELADDGYVIACARAERTTGLEERLEYVPRKKIPGSVRFDRCRKCGVVLEAANCEWDWRDGVVINHLNGLHEMVVPTSGVEALCRELTAELGEEITGMLIDIERSYTIKRIEEYGMRASLSGLSESKESSAENMEIFLSDLPLRGMGNPIGFSLDDDILRVRVNNPFNEALICGKVLGYYEALEGKKGRLQWEVPEGEWAVELEIHPD